MRRSDIPQGLTEIVLGPAAFSVLGLEGLGAASHDLLQTVVDLPQ